VPRIDLFASYRALLALLVGIYTLVRLIVFIWESPLFRPQADQGAIVALRYVGVLLLRTRFRRFAFDLAVIAALSFVLGLLVLRHGQ